MKNLNSENSNSKKELYKWYTGKYNLNVLIDPSAIQFQSLYNLHIFVGQTVRLKTALDYLKRITTPIKIDFYYPSFLKQSNWESNEFAFIPKDTIILDDETEILSNDKKNIIGIEVQQYLLSKKDEYVVKFNLPESGKNLTPNDIVQSVIFHEDGDYLFNNKGLKLFEIYEKKKFDFLITSNHILLENSDELSKDYNVFVRDWNSILVELEIFLRGHNIYIDIVDPLLGTPAYGHDISTYYPVSDQNLLRYQMLRDFFIRSNNNTKLFEYWRIAIYHRYPFLLYSYDQAKANTQYAERFNQGDRYRAHHYFLISFYINSFYLMLWGFLDNLAWILNYFYNLGFKETNQSRSKCTFINKKFKKLLLQNSPQIVALITNSEFSKWFNDLALKRHPAAHREPIFLGQFIDKNTGKLPSDRMVAVEDKNGMIFYDAVNHIEFDLKKLSEFMDKFCLVYGIKEFREYHPNL